MKVHCRTNLDLDRQCDWDWPTELPARPMKGDKIQSSSGLELTVCYVTWTQKGECNVELNLPCFGRETVEKFHEMYREFKRGY